ncbi:MAG: P-loop NTPase fold protein, partial [Thermoleophilia bacterium]
MAAEPTYSASPIVASDLIPDRALRAGDPDEFDYAPIASRVAELCNAAETPVNIALFSPWGSGKSSLYSLIERRLAVLGAHSRLIRYDAWRYGGDGLRRNFIAHAARELHLPQDDPHYSEFNRGLYENQRRVSLTLPGLWSALRNARLWPLVALAVLLAAVGALLGVDSVLIGALISTFLLLITALVDAGKVEIEQSKPSEDEEFFSRFTRLVEWATDESAPVRGARVRATERWDRFRQTVAEQVGLYRLSFWWSEKVEAWPYPLPKPRRLVF